MALKRYLFLGVLVWIFCISSFAQFINEERAEELAAKYYVEYAFGGNKPRGKLQFKLVYDCTDNLLKEQNNDVAYYYIFDVSGDRGFIIISGDERAIPVIGFSDKGRFNYHDGNGFFKEILHSYGEQMRAIMMNFRDSIPYDEQPPVRELLQRADPTIEEILPLLGETAWGQRDPYNRMCPYFHSKKARALSGCVPTAIGQIMRHHRWPKTGRGAHSYSTRTLKLELSADFSAHTFEWNKMRDKYERDCSESVGAPVARLMYLIGVATEIDYKERSTSGSGRLLVKGLIKHFGYSSDIKMHRTNNYRDNTLRELLRYEIQSNRPVFIGNGVNKKYHSYVCDGYNKQGLFHLNFGWNGRCNGYYAIGTLRKNVSDDYLSVHKEGDRMHVIFDIKPDESFNE